MKCISSCSNCQISSVFFTLFVKHSYSMCQLNVKEDTWPKFDFTILAQLDHFHMLEQPTPFLDRAAEVVAALQPGCEEMERE